MYWKDGPSGLDDLSGYAGTPAAAVAGPPPPLLSEPNPADIAKFQAEFERVKGRPLLGAK